MEELREGWVSIYMDDILIHDGQQSPPPPEMRPPSILDKLEEA